MVKPFLLKKGNPLRYTLSSPNCWSIYNAGHSFLRADTALGECRHLGSSGICSKYDANSSDETSLSRA